MQAEADPLMLIGALSQRTGASIETIRYYERIGLLAPPPRTQSRHRLYTREHVKVLTFIRRARELNYSIKDIRTLLELRNAEDRACATAQHITLRHLDEVRGKITSLRKLERALKAITARCNPDIQRACPIIDTLGACPQGKSA